MALPDTLEAYDEEARTLGSMPAEGCKLTFDTPKAAQRWRFRANRLRSLLRRDGNHQFDHLAFRIDSARPRVVIVEVPRSTFEMTAHDGSPLFVVPPRPPSFLSREEQEQAKVAGDAFFRNFNPDNLEPDQRRLWNELHAVQNPSHARQGAPDDPPPQDLDTSDPFGFGGPPGRASEKDPSTTP